MEALSYWRVSAGVEGPNVNPGVDGRTGVRGRGDEDGGPCLEAPIGVHAETRGTRMAETREQV
jgi:hypothetical protein